jgi:hypothetical protein
MRSAPAGDIASILGLRWSWFYTPLMHYFKDPVLLGLVGLLLLTVAAFLAGVLPYPFGILILLVFIVARLLSRR